MMALLSQLSGYALYLLLPALGILVAVWAFLAAWKALGHTVPLPRFLRRD